MKSRPGVLIELVNDSGIVYSDIAAMGLSIWKSLRLHGFRRQSNYISTTLPNSNYFFRCYILIMLIVQLSFV